MPNTDNFQKKPRDFAIECVEDGYIDFEGLASLLLSYMSHDDVRGALDANELSPRFIDQDDEDQDD